MTLLYTFLTVYTLFNIWVLKKINKFQSLSAKQKRIHMILIWVFPFFWYWILTQIIGDGKSKTMTVKERKNLIKKGRGGFYESKKAFDFYR
ncbi:hypothetical protein HNQ88_002922 [Aureibacter tunicatorum]|uniref:Uncharacterized protein n=1 Tax=Aureibacter tunicatorum TaxID=866807 RepID=A0AAE4BR56_9BACT|nr:hypothetical protein [Aureibacter tunicatorum]BDD04349.1 hypothetical protein AUTU_18320 [Aureibacter tunicatorum]